MKKKKEKIKKLKNKKKRHYRQRQIFKENIIYKIRKSNKN